MSIIVKLSVEQLFFLLQVLGGCLSGSENLVTEVRTLHHVLGGALNPVRHFY